MDKINVFVNVKIRTGEYEKSTKMVITDAPSEQDAFDYAMYCESHNPEDLEWDEYTVADMGWEFAYSGNGTAIIPDEDLLVLKKYFYPHTFNQEELNGSGNYLEYKGKYGHEKK